MIRLFFLTLSILLASHSFGQRNLDLKLIDKLTNDSTSEYFYSKIVFEFQHSPATIDPLKANYLYYGKLFTKTYKMFQFSADENEFNKLLGKGKYKKAIPLGENILQSDPANLDIISKLNICYKKEKQIEKADTGLLRQNILLNTVLTSGTGQEAENAFKIVAIGDEYIIMSLLGITGLSRQSIMKGTSTIDTWKIKETKSGKKSLLHFEWLVNVEQGTKNMKWPD